MNPNHELADAIDTGAHPMKIWMVATQSCYVLVEANDEAAARKLGQAALDELYAGLRTRIGRMFPVEIRTVRHATESEIELDRWHQEMTSGTH